MNRKLVNIVGVAGILILLVAGYFFVLSPFLSENGRLSENIESVESQNDNLRTKIQGVQRSQEIAADVREYDDLLDRRFPSTAEVDSLRGQIFSAASNAGITVNIDTTVPTLIEGSTNEPEAAAAVPPPEPPVEGEVVEPEDVDAPAPVPDAALPEQSGGGNLAEISLPISAEGTLNELIDFLVNISQLERSILVSGVSITSSGSEEDGPATYTLSVDAKTFLHRDIPFPITEPEQAPEGENEDLLGGDLEGRDFPLGGLLPDGPLTEEG